MTAVMDRTIISEYGLARFVLEFPPFLALDDEKFFEFCQVNRDVRIERDRDGEIVIMPPTGSESGNDNAEITRQLGNWTIGDGTGKSYDSSTGFKLPNGATRSPDASWVSNERLSKFTRSQRRKFLPLSPDLVVELRSPTDRLGNLQDKMVEYMENGSRLGWLIDTDNKRVYVYRPDKNTTVLDDPLSVSGEDVLLGFELDLSEIW